MFDGKLNPVALAPNGRRLQEHYPDHFTKVPLDLGWFYDLNPILEWIYTNCNGRFYIDIYSTPKVVGFEEPGDAVFFAMIKDQFEEKVTLDIF